MFQTSDDFDIDQDFFGDPFISDTPSTSNNVQLPPAKKFCPEIEKKKDDFVFAVPSTSKAKENILEILSRKAKKSVDDKNVKIVGKSPDRSRKNVQRKFPGPAGLLPEKQIEINIKALENCDSSERNQNETPEDIPSSQLSENCFKGSLWEEMCKEYYIDNVKLYLPEKYSISWLKTKSMSRQLVGQKTPFLAAIIKSIDYSVKNPIVILKDPTGEIPGTLHYQVWEQFAEKIHVGCVIVLRQVGILSTHRKRYLNITSNNLIIVYSYKDYNKDLYRISQSQTQRNLQMDVVRVQNIARSDILNSIEDFERSYNENSIPENDNPFFSNISFSNNNSRVQNSSFMDKSILNEFSSNLNSFIGKENVSDLPTNNLFNKQLTNKQQNSVHSNLFNKTNQNQNVKIPKKMENSNLSFPKNFPTPENQNSGIISASENEKSIYNSAFGNRNTNFPKNSIVNFPKNFPATENQNSGIISATESEKTVYNSLFNKRNENKNIGCLKNLEKSNLNFLKNFPGLENQNTGISATGNENFGFNRVFNKPNIQNSVFQKSENVIKTQNSEVISSSVDENNVYKQIFMSKKNPSGFRNVYNENKINENSSSIISGKTSQNLMNLIFKNKPPTSSEPVENNSIQNISDSFDITFEIDESQNDKFLTSTQNANSSKNKKQNMFEDSDNLLAGLEDSFLEEF